MYVSNVQHWIIAPLVSLALLVGLWVERKMEYSSGGDEDAYHARVRAAADLLPFQFGDWVGAEVEPPTSAVALLKPNVLLGRSFRNTVTDEQVTFVLVQCRDARDMGGHYPPACYPGGGWTDRGATEHEATIDGLSIPLTVYRFTKESMQDFSELVIYNFFALPTGAIEAERVGLRKSAENRRSRRFGAAQVQVITGPSMSQERRDEVFHMLISEARPVLDTILQGGQR